MAKVTAKEIPGTEGKSLEEYQLVFNKLPKEVQVKHLKHVIRYMNISVLKTDNVDELLTYIKDVVEDALPKKEVSEKDLTAWEDLRSGRLTVKSSDYLTRNVWKITSTQTLRGNCTYKDLIVSINLKEIVLTEGIPQDAYIEFVLKCLANRDKMAEKVQEFEQDFINAAGYKYLSVLNRKLNRQKGNYVDYKDIRVVSYQYNKQSNVIMARIGVKEDYVPLPEDIPEKKPKKTIEEFFKENEQIEVSTESEGV